MFINFYKFKHYKNHIIMLETGILPFSHLKIEDWFDLDSVLIKHLHFTLILFIEYIILILSSYGILGIVGKLWQPSLLTVQALKASF